MTAKLKSTPAPTFKEAAASLAVDQYYRVAAVTGAVLDYQKDEKHFPVIFLLPKEKQP